MTPFMKQIVEQGKFQMSGYMKAIFLRVL